MDGAVAAVDGDFFAFFEELGCAGENDRGIFISRATTAP